MFGSVACQSGASSPEVYTLTVIKVGTGDGTVSSSPSGLNCGEVCTASFQKGTIVTLTATPNGNSSFKTWSGDLAGTTNPQSLTMDGDKTVTVTFTRIAYIITGTVTVGGAGLEGVTMAGLPGSPVTDASGAYSAAVNSGSNITVSPTLYAYTFDPASNTYTNVTADMPAQDYEATLIQTSQRKSLIALYNSTNGDGWTNNFGWKASPLYPDGFAMPGTESTWYGLTVDSGTQTVTGIDFSSNNLVGTIPAELGNLTSLINLNLHGNPLTGSIAAEIGTLTALQYLYLNNCQLTGSIPAEIGNLTNLSLIDLGNNQLSGSIPAEIGNLTKLVKLFLNDNQLSGSIPAELGSLPNLGYLYLNTNQLSGSIPLELCSLSNLRQLFLYSNELSGSIPPELGNLINLTWIVLRYNQLSGEIPAELGNIANLQVLRLGDNQLSGEIPAELGHLTNLQSLRLAHNQLSGEIPDTLGNLTQLWEMLINSNQLTGPIPTSLANLTALTTTDFGYNALYTSDEALIAFLNTKDADWAATQTIAPTGITATSLDNAVIMVSWLPVTYTANTGYYRVLISEAPGGPYTLAGQTTNKATAAVNVTGLTPGTRYYFVVQTITNAHANNQNIVESAYSTEATAIAWLQLNVQITGTITLGGAPLSGVVMTGLTGSPVTNASGVYIGTEAAGWSGLVTPTLEGYSFDPLSRTYSHLTTNQTSQDYAAAVVVPTITVTSPNGGETLAVGSAHNVTWTQTGLTGSVTIDLYKGGVWLKTLGTAEGTAGSLSWLIGAGETIATDYTILVWQSGYSDDSDVNFALARSLVRVDFNKDGQEDILWRHYGMGGYNRAWFLGNLGQAGLPPAGVGPQMAMSSVAQLSGNRAIGKTNRSQQDMGMLSNRPKKSPLKGTQDVLGIMNRQAAHSAFIDDPRKAEGEMTEPSNITIADPRQVGLVQTTSSNALVTLASTPSYLGGGDLMPVGDLSWQIVGTGDFNNDTYVDILWRNGSTGSNVVWYLNGTQWTGSVELLRVSDLSWQIVGTGDFNKDGSVDILWRNGVSGSNVVWYMNGAEWIGSAVLLGVSDLNWQIVGTGDFNKDGNIDILWRYNGAGGYNVVWYMNNAIWTGSAELIPVADPTWQIMGTGDYNNDGNIDILWRYNGTGGYNYIWYLDGVTWIGGGDLLPVADLTWKIVSSKDLLSNETPRSILDRT